MLNKYYEQIISKYPTKRSFITHAINKLDEYWDDKNLFVIEAPTGYGKSTITATLALKAYNEYSKLIVAFPLRTLLEDQYNKLNEVIEDENVLGKRYMHEADSRYLIKPITLTTIDTLALTMFGIAPEDLSNVMKHFNEWTGTMQGSSGHYLFSWSSVALSDIILDEVHLLSDSTKSLNFLIALIRHVITNDQKIVLMSATMPCVFKGKLKNALYKYEDKISFITFNDNKDTEFIDNRREKRYKINIKYIDNKSKTIASWLDEGFKAGKRRALIIFNTVNDAIELYNEINNRYKNCLLLHSRFSDNDRREKNKLLQTLKEKDEYVIIATQVVEAGVDISSDLLICELAPANSLIQRFGRFLRYEEDEGLCYIWHEEFKDGRYKVYDLELCKRTLDYLKKNNINMHISNDNGYYKLLDNVYSEDSIKIDKNKINEMLITFTNFGNISSAVRLFYELEGSFVREGSIIPVTVKSYERSAIPISYGSFKKLLSNKKVECIIKQDKMEKIELEEIERMNEKRLLSYIIKKNIRSFVIESDYDNEIGLIL